MTLRRRNSPAESSSNVCTRNAYGHRSGAGLAVDEASSHENINLKLVSVRCLVQNTAISKFAKYMEPKIMFSI